jgi:hypothetical protein
MKNTEFTSEDIKKIEKTIQHIFTSLKKNISFVSCEIETRGNGKKFNNFNLKVLIEGQKSPILVYSNKETLVLDIWNIAIQICEKLEIKENDPIYKLLREGDKANYKKIEEFIKLLN